MEHIISHKRELLCVTMDNFRKWCNENGYTKGLRLNRIDSTKDYCPENCVLGKKNQTSKRLQDNFDKDNKLKSELNYGIADMEAGRELPLDEAMEKITELRNVFSGLEKLEKHDKQKHLYQLMTKLNEAEIFIRDNGTISADELESELGVSD